MITGSYIIPVGGFWAILGSCIVSLSSKKLRLKLQTELENLGTFHFPQADLITFKLEKTFWLCWFFAWWSFVFVKLNCSKLVCCQCFSRSVLFIYFNLIFIFILCPWIFFPHDKILFTFNNVSVSWKGLCSHNVFLSGSVFF